MDSSEMLFNPENQLISGLPVLGLIPQLKKSFENQTGLLLSASPGAGKSTVVPIALMEENWLKGKKIVMLEPRRLAARTIASRMSAILGEEVGKTVGYRVRFENKISPQTRTEVLTEGILTRMLQTDNSLEEVGLVIFDEFHERSLFSDTALVLCLEAQQVLRPDMRILIMSATLDVHSLSGVLNFPFLECRGRQYPVDIVYTGQCDETAIPEMVAETVYKAVKEKTGDCLVFLPGEAEIRKCEEILRQNLHGFVISPLYGQMPIGQQNFAILPDVAGRRKVVLATSIAETSLTIEGISIVVDCGFGRVALFDPNSGLSRLETFRISKESADQRAGRAGRLGPGTCFRMWTAATQDRMAEHRVPEILEADLASLVLHLAQWGVKDVFQLSWPTKPPKGNLAQASYLLHQLKALEDDKITPHGRQMNHLPCHPRIAHMLILAQKHKMLPLAADLAAVLEERDPLPKGSGTDINLRLEALRNFRKEGRGGRNLTRLLKIAEQYCRLFDNQPDNSAVDSSETGLLLAFAYPERIACSRPGNNAQFQLSNGRYAAMDYSDNLAHEPWLSVANMDARSGLGKIFLASPLNPKDLAGFVTEQETVIWDSRQGGLVAAKEVRLGSLVLKSQALTKVNEKLHAQAVSLAIKNEGETLFEFDEDVVNWQNRVLSLRIWDTGLQWPDVSTKNMLEENQIWFGEYFTRIKKNEDFKKWKLLNIFQDWFGREKLNLLNSLAPVEIEVPSGSKIKLRYFSNGAPPVLAVRLQEVFGMAETPSVCRGKIPVVMHLLSPGFKPVQVTSDLRSFWGNAYFEVKKELKRRYPKHSWPDNPWQATAVAGVKRRK